MPQKPNQPAKPSDACQRALNEPGEIAYGGVSGTLADVLGLSGGFGKFTNLKTGTTGYYATGGGAGGEEASVTLGGGVASSLASFVGFSVNL